MREREREERKREKWREERKREKRESKMMLVTSNRTIEYVKAFTVSQFLGIFARIENFLIPSI